MEPKMPRLTGAVLALFAAAPAAAQDNALRSAADAFGERAGIEQAGLYTENQVRGFDLNDSGGYRIDDAYFSRASPLDDTILAGVGVRVGVNAARLAYPAPSGVVTYRLREPAPVDFLRMGAGLRDFGTRVVQGDGSFRDGDFSLAGGFVWRPLTRYAQGYEGHGVSFGAVGAWEIAPSQRLRAFGSLYQRRYDGDYAVVPTGTALPPSLRPLHQYSPSWAYSKAVNTNLGVLYDGQLAGFTVDLSAFRSIFDIDHDDFTIIAADAAGHADATTLRSPGPTTRSDSIEARVSRPLEGGQVSQFVSLSARARRTTTHLASSLAIPLGTFALPDGDPPAVPEPIWTGSRGEDRVEQETLSIGYGLAWRDRLQVRLGGHRTHYAKTVLSASGARTARLTDTTHFNVSAVVGVTNRTALFGSWVTGLEEAGIAPTSATNRDEVLPPVEARQLELGLRHTIGPHLTLIAAAFDVSKPTQGFHADGSFGLVGRVRHRGVEGSIAGTLDEKTRIVAGVVAFQPKVTGPLVDAGLVGGRAAGISQVVASANLERQLGDGWSVDAGVTYFGPRWADTANTFKAPAVTTLNLGARRRFDLAGRAAEFRILGSNLNGQAGYLAPPSGLLSPIPPRTVRVALTVTLERSGSR
jgi:iron complex outermembrane receptor protein